jgi:hypothetical protein
MQEDPRGIGEWMAEFRDDISAFVSREAIDACVSPTCSNGREFRREVFGVCRSSGGSPTA